MASEPRAERPYMPGYGIPTGPEGLLEWSWAVELLGRVRNPVVSTVRPDGRPHAMPVWGVWLDGAYWFSTAITSVKSVNLKADARCVITAGEDPSAVIIEGEAELADLTQAFVRAYREKYDHTIDDGPVWRVRPSVAFAFQETDDFARTATRWRFEA